MHNVRRLTAEGIAAYRDWLKKGATGPAAFSKGSDASVRSWVRVRAPQFPSGRKPYGNQERHAAGIAVPVVLPAFAGLIVEMIVNLGVQNALG